MSNKLVCFDYITQPGEVYTSSVFIYTSKNEKMSKIQTKKKKNEIEKYF